MLKRYHEELLHFSLCSGIIPRMLFEGRPEEKREALGKKSAQDIFRDDFYLNSKITACLIQVGADMPIEPLSVCR